MATPAKKTAAPVQGGKDQPVQVEPVQATAVRSKAVSSKLVGGLPSGFVAESKGGMDPEKLAIDAGLKESIKDQDQGGEGWVQLEGYTGHTDPKKAKGNKENAKRLQRLVANRGQQFKPNKVKVNTVYGEHNGAEVFMFKANTTGDADE